MHQGLRPNITGGLTGYEFAGGIWGAGALFEDTENIFNLTRDKGVSGNNGTSPVMGFDASKSNSIYGASTTVQPPALRLLPCIKC